MSITLDEAHLRTWIGRTTEDVEQLSSRQVARFAASLDPLLPEATEWAPGAPAPLGVHWMLAPVAVPRSATGVDGHPARGEFIPPVPLKRRMWAGGMLRFIEPLRVGDTVERRSCIADVKVKHGRAGSLCFVTVDHEISTERGIVLYERQDIVFLEPAEPVVPVAGGRAATVPGPRAMMTNELDLFRYSALTFNGHRIHYDRSYAASEGYPDLVVHGPLQATVLMNHAAYILASRGPLASFGFRGVRPLFVNQPFELHVNQQTADGVRLELRDEQAEPTMTAEALL